VQVTLNGASLNSEQNAQTTVARKTLNPVWNAAFAFRVPESKSISRKNDNNNDDDDKADEATFLFTLRDYNRYLSDQTIAHKRISVRALRRLARHAARFSVDDEKRQEKNVFLEIVESDNDNDDDDDDNDKDRDVKTTSKTHDGKKRRHRHRVETHAGNDNFEQFNELRLSMHTIVGCHDEDVI
jgi:hypothetical protein